MSTIIKMDVLYDVVNDLIDWNNKPVGDEVSDYDAQINADDNHKKNMRLKYKKLMMLIAGTISSGYMDNISYFIDTIDAPVVAALLIRTACDKDKRYIKYRAWLSGKYTNHPERHYADILELSSDIENMLDLLQKKELYVPDLEEMLRQTYPDIELSLPLERKNLWETLIKDSMHYNEAMMLKTVIPLIHDIEKYIIILPQGFDDGSLEADNQRMIKNCVNFSDRLSLFDDEETEQLPIPQLLEQARYQEKYRNLLVHLLQRTRRHLIGKAAAKALTLDNPDDYLSYVAAEKGLSPEATERLITEFYETAYDGYPGPDYRMAESETFLPLDTINSLRFLKLVHNDELIQTLLKEKRD